MSGTSSPEQRAKLARKYWAGLEQRPSNLTPSRTYGNSMMPPGSLVVPVMRSGRGEAADQHFQFSSRGQTAPQLNRNAGTQQV